MGQYMKRSTFGAEGQGHSRPRIDWRPGGGMILDFLRSCGFYTELKLCCCTVENVRSASKFAANTASTTTWYDECKTTQAIRT